MARMLSEKEMKILTEVQADHYHFMLSRLANTDCKAREQRRKKGCHDFIGHSLPPVAEGIAKSVKFLKKTKKHPIYYPKFLDCGCGWGNIMLLAHDLGCSAYGIDLNTRALKLARIIVKSRDNLDAKRFVVYQRDILTYKDYGKYDIVYYYCPMQNGRLERQFEIRLADEMRVGAIILPFYSTYTFVKDKRFVPLEKLPNDDIIYTYGSIMMKTKE
jgi:16S rRNA G1207 methylase RsmC